MSEETAQANNIVKSWKDGIVGKIAALIVTAGVAGGGGVFGGAKLGSKDVDDLAKKFDKHTKMMYRYMSKEKEKWEEKIRKLQLDNVKLRSDYDHLKEDHDSTNKEIKDKLARINDRIDNIKK